MKSPTSSGKDTSTPHPLHQVLHPLPQVLPPLSQVMDKEGTTDKEICSGENTMDCLFDESHDKALNISENSTEVEAIRSGGSVGEDEEQVSSDDISGDNCSDLDSEDEKELEREMALWKRIEKLRMKIEARHMRRINRKLDRNKPYGKGRRLDKSTFYTGYPWHQHPGMMGMHPPPPPPPPSPFIHGPHMLENRQGGLNSAGLTHQEQFWRPGAGPRRLRGMGPRLPFNFHGMDSKGKAYTKAVEDSHISMPPPPPPYPGYGPFHPVFSPPSFQNHFNRPACDCDASSESVITNDATPSVQGAYQDWRPWHQELSTVSGREKLDHPKLL